MADEISLSISLNASKDNFEFNQSESVTIDQSTAGGGNPGTVTVGVTEETIDFGDAAGSLGYVWLKNLDATNFVEWGPLEAGTGGAMVVAGRLKAGEISCLRLSPSQTYLIKADTAPCKVLIQALWN